MSKITPPPAMTDEQVNNTWGAFDGPYYAVARAIEAARDKQWLDMLAHLEKTEQEHFGDADARTGIYDAATYASAMAVFMTRMDAEQPDADDKGVSGWLQDAEDRIRSRASQPLEKLISQADRQRVPDGWVETSKVMPPSGQVVLACYKNELGNTRRIRAQWVAEKTSEASIDSDCGEYDEATDTYYDPEGWYECIDNWDCYSSVFVSAQITHWMPLPPAPDAAAAAPEAPEQTVPDAMKTIIAAMQDDPDYAWSWHCNVAMAFVDAGGDHYTANQGAARFMRLLANVGPAHELPAAPEAPAQASAVDERATPAVTEFNVGRWCLSEDDCIEQGIDFAAYERGVADAATAFGRNRARVANGIGGGGKR